MGKNEKIKMTPDRKTEESIIGVTYRYEKSSLNELNYDFPMLDGRKFIQWIDCFATGGRFLEIGGGRDQIAARQIMARFKAITSYIGLEPRALTPEAEADLPKPNFRWIRGNVSNMTEILAGESFDVIFAHNVLEHTEFPVVTVKQSYDLLKPGGILFCNKVPMAIEVLRKFICLLRQGGVSVADGEDYSESSWLKAGITNASLAIRRREEFSIPAVKAGGYLNTFTGKRLDARNCYF